MRSGCGRRAKPPRSSGPTAITVKVVDASALASLLFGEPEADAIAALLDDARLTAPALLGFELANVCLMKSRRHPERRDALSAAFQLRGRLKVAEAAVEHDGVLKLANETGLTVYDASYVWLAERLRAELVTLDRKLAEVARARRTS